MWKRLCAMEIDAGVFQQPLTKSILCLLIILCYYVFVTRKRVMYKCGTPIPMDFIKHKALMFIRGFGFIDLHLTGLEGKKTLLVLWGCRHCFTGSISATRSVLNS